MTGQRLTSFDTGHDALLELLLDPHPDVAQVRISERGVVLPDLLLNSNLRTTLLLY